MIIDFHTHIFPDKVAAKAIPKLAAGNKLTPSMNGTMDGLKASMETAEIDLSVVLPVITDPHQFESVLKFSVQINETCFSSGSPRLLSFGGVHPESANVKEQLTAIKNEGIQGIKLHPQYQGMPLNDIRYLRMIYTASELGLIVLTHAGFDVFIPDKDYCTPDMITQVLDEVAPPKMVLAHMGNNEHYEEVMQKLCGRNVYFDTSYSFVHMPEELFIKLVRAHGAEKILFASDAPWTAQKDGVEKLRHLTGLSEEEKRLIFSQNAIELLGLSLYM